MYVHAWMNEWCVCTCVFMHISSLAVCAQFDSAVACDHRSTPPGCTIPALIFRSSPKYKACELEVFELRMWLFYCL